jgi:hypothetical protein
MAQFSPDPHDDALRFSHDFVVPEPQYSIALCLEILIPMCVLGGGGVLGTIGLHDEFRLETHKIDDIRPERHLTFEFMSLNPSAAQCLPKHIFGFGRISSHGFREGALSWLNRRGHGFPLLG